MYKIVHFYITFFVHSYIIINNEDILNKIKTDSISKKIPSDIIAKFYLGGVINLGVEWLSDNSKYTKDQIVEYLKILIPDNIN